MKTRIGISMGLLLAAAAFSRVGADDLTRGYQKGRDYVKELKPMSSSKSNSARDAREEKTSASAQPGDPDRPDRRDRPDPAERRRDEEERAREREEEAREREREREEEEAERRAAAARERAKRLEEEAGARERQRIRKNLELIDSGLAAANKPPARTPSLDGSRGSAASISERERELDALVHSNDTLDAQRVASAYREEALRNAQLVSASTSRGEKPPFKPLWDYYKYNRPIALGLVGETNKCAIVLSLTLGLEPRSGEKSLQDLGNKELIKNIVGPANTMLAAPVKDKLATRIYVQAQQLANRLKSEWGAPASLSGKDARAFISGKKGVIFLQGAYPALRRSGDHLDLWDSDRAAASPRLPLESAREVWFWEIP